MRAVCLLAVIAALPAAGQPRSERLNPPFGPANGLVSPNGAHALFRSDKAPQLWLENNRTHERKLVFEVTVQTLTLVWSPDSTAFIANDRSSSDLEFACTIEVNKFARHDLRRLILAADPEATHFVPGQDAAPHSYFHAIRWLDSTHVEVQLHGHTDGTWSAGSLRPGDCFDLRYSVNKDGAVRKLSRRISPITSKGCDSPE